MQAVTMYADYRYPAVSPNALLAARAKPTGFRIRKCSFPRYWGLSLKSCRRFEGEQLV
jgi:hypothetical protein